GPVGHSLGMLAGAGSSRRGKSSVARHSTPAETPTDRGAEHRGAGELQVDDFMFGHTMGCVGLALITLVRLLWIGPPLAFVLLGLAAVSLLYGSLHAHWHHRVRIHVLDERVRVSSPWRRINLTPRRILHVSASPGVLSLLLVDGRLV